ncbi:MAG: hypothetical protein ABW106_01375 [Steroidobacteraceae bacterium]
MRSAHLLLSALATLALCGPLAHAEELEMAKPPHSEANRPARGMTMQKVEAAFGAPASRVPAIGSPPISRWEYPGFVVFFEHDHVIHTVGIG